MYETILKRNTVRKIKMIERDLCRGQENFEKVNAIPEIGGSIEKYHTVTKDFQLRLDEYLCENLDKDNRARIFNRFINGYNPFSGCTQPCFGFVGGTMEVKEIQEIINRVNFWYENKDKKLYKITHWYTPKKIREQFNIVCWISVIGYILFWLCQLF